jgi:hypothetical protein
LVIGGGHRAGQRTQPAGWNQPQPSFHAIINGSNPGLLP